MPAQQCQQQELPRIRDHQRLRPMLVRKDQVTRAGGIGGGEVRSPKLEWIDHPTMNPRNTRQLRPLIERWQIAHLWGQPSRIKPRLVTEVFGDGRRLLALYPIMYRPNHFVVRMDSKIEITYADDWLDDIYESIEDEFGEWPWAKAYGLTWHEDAEDENDSRVSFDDGSSWSEMLWPRLKKQQEKCGSAVGR